MQISTEVWLVIGIYGFYLFDSTKLLYQNQLIIFKGYGGWKIICPDSRWQVLRKMPYVFNPFLPNIPVFCGTWSIASESDNVDVTPELNKYIVALYPLNYFMIFLQTLLCIAMPITLFWFGAGVGVLIITVSIYATILVMLAVLYVKKSEIGLTTKNYFSIAFDCIACPPFAINMVRKISWRYKINFSPLEFAINNLSMSDSSKFARILISRLDEALSYEDDDNTVRSGKLKAYKSKLRELYQ